MRSLTVSTLAVLTALTSVVAVKPALAQYGSAAPAQPVAAPPNVAAAAATPAALCQAGISKGARAAIVALQTAVAAKDSANIPARIAAAQALAKSNDDRCFIAQMQVKAAVDANDLKAVPAALEAQLASGSVPATRIADLYEGLGQSFYRSADYGGAASAYERVAALAPGRSSAVIMLAEVRAKQNRVADALPLYRKAIAIETGAGRVADSKWYGRALSVAYEAKNPLAFGLSRDWVAAYPSPANWRDAVRIYSNVSGANDDIMIDLYRLQRLTKSLAGESDHARYAQALITKGFAGEAKAMLDESFATKAVDPTRASIKSYHVLATSRAAGDRASLDGQAKAALANPAAKPAMVLGEAYFGYGDHAKAAAMFRAAQGKSGVDAELASLRLGMALAASGDKAGAATALARVTGPRAEVARYWETYAKLRP
ncbi:MAG: hypothetical protein LH466_10840 [Sphingomonas bacterium]|nr:hypothetical protein [Sphingomonas bacterium]